MFGPACKHIQQCHSVTESWSAAKRSTLTSLLVEHRRDATSHEIYREKLLDCPDTWVWKILYWCEFLMMIASGHKWSRFVSQHVSQQASPVPGRGNHWNSSNVEAYNSCTCQNSSSCQAVATFLRSIPLRQSVLSSLDVECLYWILICTTSAAVCG